MPVKSVTPRRIAESLGECWSPRVIGEIDDSYIKVARLQGPFIWHSHPAEDEMFLVLKGRLRIDMEHDSVELGEGDLFVVPKGVRHNPIAEEECCVLLIEKKSTAHTGDVITAQTRSIEEQLDSPAAGDVPAPVSQLRHKKNSCPPRGGVSRPRQIRPASAAQAALPGGDRWAC